MSLIIENLSCGYGKKTLVKNINLEVNTGDIMCILGPNGVGKTTLFKTIQGFLPAHNGRVLLNGQNLQNLKHQELAKMLAYVPQTHIGGCSYPVREVVVMGRTAHLGIFASPTQKDYDICDEMLTKLHINHLADCLYSQISGGEKQMALIARALVQKPQMLMMDEPTSNLDFGNQIKVLQQIVNLAHEGIGIIMTTHVPDHALMCSTKVALFHRDHSFHYGTAPEIVTPENLEAAYDIPVKMVSTLDIDGSERKSCIPLLNKQPNNIVHLADNANNNPNMAVNQQRF